MNKIIVIAGFLLLISLCAFADDVSIDSSGNMTTGISNTDANLEVIGSSGEDGIVGSTSGTEAAGVYGVNTTNNNYGILGYDISGVYGNSPSGWAGYFQGHARITGNLTVDGSIINALPYAINNQSCVGGQMVTGIDIEGNVTCSSDQNDVYTAGTGITISGSNEIINDFGISIETGEISDGTIQFIDIGQNSCADGQTMKWKNAGSGWKCANDIDTDTTLSEAEVDTFVSNNGYVTTETDPSVNALGKTTLSCSSNQVVKWNGSSWICADGDADWTISGTDMYSGVTGKVGIGTSAPDYKFEVRGGTSDYLAYFYNENKGSGTTRGLYARGDAYGTGTDAGLGGSFRGVGGSTGGQAQGIASLAYAYGSSAAYGVYSNATLGSTTGREWAFYGEGDSYFSGDVGIGIDNPGYKLDVQGGNSSYLGYFKNDNNSSGENAQGIFVEADAYGTGTGKAYGTRINAWGGSTSGDAFGTMIYTEANGSSTAYGVWSSAIGGNTTGNKYAFYGIGDSYFSGYVGIGDSTPDYKLDVVGSASTGHVAMFENTSTSNNADGIIVEVGPSSNPGASNYFIRFQDGDGSQIGGVRGNGAAGVTYATTSDARLKTKIYDFEEGLEMVSRMKVRKYELTEAPGNERIGFLAQELQNVFPQAVSGDPAGDVTEEPMGVDYGRVTPVLVAAIQELKAGNEALLAENEILKEEIIEIKAALGL